MKTMNSPATSFQACSTASHTDKSRADKLNVTRSDWPASRKTFRNALSCIGGSPAVGGKPRYSWTTVAPARSPVLVTVAETESADALRPLRAKVEYESPWPKAKAGATLCASYHR